MKLILTLLSIIILSTNSTAQNKKFANAVEYNDFIVKEQAKIGNKIQDFNKTFEQTTDSTIMHIARKEIINQVDSSIKQLRKMVPFNADTSLKKSAISLFYFYRKAAVNEYAKIITIFLNNKISNDEKLKQFQDTYKLVTETEAIYDENFALAQRAFAVKHNIKLE